MSDYHQIKEFLKSRDYCVKVKKTKNGLQATFPTRKLYPTFEGMERVYRVRYGSVSGLYFKTSRDEKEYFIRVPEYAIRVIVAADIVRTCEAIGYSPTLLTFYDEEENQVQDEEADIISLITPSKKSDQRKLEESLQDLVLDCYGSNFELDLAEDAEKMGVSEGYDLFLKIFQET